MAVRTASATTFSEPLVQWYARSKRALPWRRAADSRDPYKILVSEVMLQQTQVKTAIPYYARFLKRFPTLQTLARASEHSVLKAWEGAGYYQRARNLHRAAKEITQNKKYSGKLPHTYGQLIELPGFGPYTAAAVSSIAFGEDRAVVDGNVKRVIARAFAIPTDVNTPKTTRKIQSLVDSLLLTGRAGDFNQAIMELGATVCTPRQPKCDKCPVRSVCQAFQMGKQEQYPKKSKRKPVPHVQVAIGAVYRPDGTFLITRRAKGRFLAGLWELPGGKINRGESETHAVKREVFEETGLRVRVKRKIATVNHAFSSKTVTLHVWKCALLPGIAGGTLTLDGVQDAKWVRKGDLKRFAFPRANQKFFRAL